MCKSHRVDLLVREFHEEVVRDHRVERRGVEDIAAQHPDKEIFSASGIQCACSTMYRIDPPHLLWALENLVEGNVVNPIRVDADVAAGATVALERMLSLRGDGAVGKRQQA